VNAGFTPAAVAAPSAVFGGGMSEAGIAVEAMIGAAGESAMLHTAEASRLARETSFGAAEAAPGTRETSRRPTEATCMSAEPAEASRRAGKSARVSAKTTAKAARGATLCVAPGTAAAMLPSGLSRGAGYRTSDEGSCQGDP
jgi:hypothetical protein